MEPTNRAGQGLSKEVKAKCEMRLTTMATQRELVAKYTKEVIDAKDNLVTKSC